MKIEWHCRNCNEQGERDVDLFATIQKRTNEDLLVLLMKEVNHCCEEPGALIGIKVKENK